MSSFEHFNNSEISTVFLYTRVSKIKATEHYSEYKFNLGFRLVFSKKIQPSFVYLKDSGHFHLSTMFSKLFFTFFLSTHT